MSVIKSLIRNRFANFYGEVFILLPVHFIRQKQHFNIGFDIELFSQVCQVVKEF